tara:strand:+ start:212 stop:448 length:237 start_codon:yes stop_codon:yes gene_type:complete
MKTFNKLMGDIETVKGLVNQYKPVIKQKVKEYEPLIKNDAMKIKNQFEKEVLPGLKGIANSFEIKNKNFKSNSSDKKK